MKNELISSLIKDCCKDRECDECPFSYSEFKCYLIDMIELIKKYDIKENDNYEK